MTAKKISRIICCVISVALIACLTIFFITKNKKSEVEHENPKSGYAEKVSLPDFELVNADRSPLMYDFLNGSISWKSSIFPFERGFVTIIAIQPDHPEAMWASRYDWAEDLSLPPLGTMPFYFSLDGVESQNVMTSIEHIDDEMKWQEGDWLFVAIPEKLYYDDDLYRVSGMDGKWAGIQIVGINYEFGRMYQAIYGDFIGYPTNWLRNERWHDIVSEKAFLNIDNGFWDTWNLYERRNYAKDGDNEILTATVKQFQTFEVTRSSKKDSMTLNSDQLNHLLDFEGWKIVERS